MNQMSWKPVPGNIMTRWAADVTPENAWREYPRPQMIRSEWQNLNGLWDYAIVPVEQEYPAAYDGSILVPYPVESALSGVKRVVKADQRIFYRRIFTIPSAWQGRRILLHFGAVDWEASVTVNGQYLGSHRGGYLPFWFDITSSLQEGDNELVVSVWDPTDTFWQQRGKQSLKPRSIWYTAVSGIWQTVWLEPVPERFICGLKITPDIDSGTVGIKVNLAGSGTGHGEITVNVSDEGDLLAHARADVATGQVTLPMQFSQLWSPDSPHLYDLSVSIGDDKVLGYFAMRKFSVENGRLCLNHQPFFQIGPLDQGYWPDGLYTPPSDEAMLWDLHLIKRLGFNMLRKHVKVEPARFYSYCDRLGLIVWQDMPNGGTIVGDLPTFIALVLGSRRHDSNYRPAGRIEADSRENFLHELKEMVDHLYSFACIGMWVPFNEGWGQYDANTIAGWLRSYDPTHPIDHASGFYDQGGGDVKSLHVYFKKLAVIKPEKKRAWIISEFGGFSRKIEQHLWNPLKVFGYKKFSGFDLLTNAYLDLLKSELHPCIQAGLSAVVYTQLTDVEIELNGFVTYDRMIEKLDFGKVREAHVQLTAGLPLSLEKE
jgi:beta-galactosidase/beta-glucuronidase